MIEKQITANRFPDAGERTEKIKLIRILRYEILCCALFHAPLASRGNDPAESVERSELERLFAQKALSQEARRYFVEVWGVDQCRATLDDADIATLEPHPHGNWYATLSTDLIKILIGNFRGIKENTEAFWEFRERYKEIYSDYSTYNNKEQYEKAKTIY